MLQHLAATQWRLLLLARPRPRRGSEGSKELGGQRRRREGVARALTTSIDSPPSTTSAGSSKWPSSTPSGSKSPSQQPHARPPGSNGSQAPRSGRTGRPRGPSGRRGSGGRRLLANPLIALISSHDTLSRCLKLPMISTTPACLPSGTPSLASFASALKPPGRPASSHSNINSCWP